MIKRVKTAAKFLLFLGLGFFLLWLTTKSFGKEEIQKVKEGVAEANFTVIVLCSLILLFSHYLRALRWKMMIIPVGIVPKNSNVFFAVLAGYFFNLLFPRLGEVMKCSFLSKYEKAPVDKLIGTMVAERLVDFVCLVIVILLTVFTQLDIVGDYANELYVLLKTKMQISLTGWMMLIACASLLLYFVVKLLRGSKNHPSLFKVKALVKGMLEGLTSIKKVHSFGLYFLYTFAIWFCYLISIRIGFYGMKELEHLGWIPSFSILTFGSFAMIATQGGIGAYQLAVQKTLILYSIDQVNGLAFGWLLWLVQTMILFIVGPLSVFFLYLFNQKPTSRET